MISLTIVRVIEAPPAAVFAAFGEPDKIALWWQDWNGAFDKLQRNAQKL